MVELGPPFDHRLVTFFKHNFCVKPYVPREPRRDPSNRRLYEHGIYIRHCQKSNSQPVPTQVLFQQSPLISAPAENVEDYADQLQNVSNDIINNLASLKSKTRTKPTKPHVWLTTEVQKAKRERRRRERVWKSSRSEEDRKLYRKQCKIANTLIEQLLRDYNQRQVNEAQQGSRQQWKRIKNILYPSNAAVRPAIAISPETFMKFFAQKVTNIRNLISIACGTNYADPLGSDRRHTGDPGSLPQG